MLNYFSNNIKNIFRSELCVQRYPQIQLNLSEKTTTQTLPYTELMAGHSPFTFNLWVPFNDVEHQSGIFIIDSDKSVELCDYELSNQTQSRWDIIKDHIHFPKIRYGEALLFNSFVYHGTIKHSVKKAKISADVRFQSVNKPLYQKFNEFLK
jgi:hypothetical protein